MDAKRDAFDRPVGLQTFSWARFAVVMALIGTPCIACACLLIRESAPDRTQAMPAAAQAVSRPLVIVIPSPLVAAQRDGVDDASPMPAPSHATTSRCPGAKKPVVHDGFEQSSTPPHVAQPPTAQPSGKPTGEAALVQVAATAGVKEGVPESPAALPGSVIQTAASNPAVPQLPPLPGAGEVPSAPVGPPLTPATLPGSVIQTAASDPAAPQLPPLPEVPSTPVGPPPHRPAPAILPPTTVAAPSVPAAVTPTDASTGATAGVALPPPDGVPAPPPGPSFEVPAPGSGVQDAKKPLPPNSALELPAPNVLTMGIPANHPVPSSMWSPPADMPQPTEQELDTIRNHVEGVVDPNCILDLVQGRTRLLKLKKPARSVHVSGTKVISCTPVNGREIAIQARAVGTTVLHLTFGEVDTTDDVEVRYLVRVFPALTAREPYEAIFRALEAEIAGLFPESKVQLKLVGEAVLVAGQVREARDARAIVQLVVANTPWADCHATAGPGEVLAVAGSSSTHVINRLQIAHAAPYQVTLKVAVVELSRNTLSSLFGKGPAVSPDMNHSAGAIAPAVYDVSGARMSVAWGAAALSNVKPANVTDGRPMPEPRQILLYGQPASLVTTVQGLVTASPDKTPGEQRSVTLELQGIELSFTPVCVQRESLRVMVATTPGQPGTGRPFQSTITVRDGQTLAFTGLLPPIAREHDPQRTAGRWSMLGRFVGVEQPAASERQMVILLLPEVVGTH
jgi:pilus assembly protein CpaC